MQPYEKLEAWQRCHELVLTVYEATKTFPSHERFGLTAQARRAAFSAAANLVEGSAKRGPAEFRRFLDISLGSLAELGYTIRLARELGYLNADSACALDNVHRRAAQVTWGLYRAIVRRRPNQRSGDPSIRRS